MATYYRDERAARLQSPLVSTLSQGVEEGYRLVGPDGTLTSVVAYAQWLDGHPDGPDTHVMISFEDGTNVEFPFGIRLTAVWHDEQRVVAPAELAEASPAAWGVTAQPWR
ncbi:hypothetical protein OG949_26005 [Streptomyces scopuliridis]|uniref:hypothetical protein n=1 Tax=Streptomyces scopuliridis TaxID=452529 RepID=UPI002DDC1D0C|nr:hypothetical protein [Streptomyces scopuliridis]WSB35959.1 hypothetical protein OG949_26005 [Streptomyces scopuliridis]